MNDLIILDDADQTEPPARDLDAEIVAKRQEIVEAVEQAQRAVQEEQTGQALVLRSEGDVQAVKSQMVAMKRRVTSMQMVLGQKRKELEALQRDQMREMERVMNEVMVPLQEKMELMQEGIWSVNLYLGTRQEIVRITEGKPAPADTPVHIRQRVLAMDEEMMVGTEDGGYGTGFGNAEIFDEWVQQPGNLDQVLPEQKGIVGLLSRQMRYIEDDPRWHWTYFLIRNGENLYRIMVDEFVAASGLIPKADEFDQFYTSKDRRTGEAVKLEPGTEEWTRAEKAAGKRQRHFMRIAMLLEGLVHRTAVLHPQPKAGLSFVTPDPVLDGRIVAITDDELVLETGKETFRQMQARLLSELRPGMRVIGSFNSSTWYDALKASREEESYEDPRIRPAKANQPESGSIYVIDKLRSDGGMEFKYARTDRSVKRIVGYRHRAGDPHPKGENYVYRYDSEIVEWNVPKTRATCIVFPQDDFILPYDLLSVEQMQSFLDDRVNREEYVTMLPLLRSALTAKQAEVEAEAPMRALIVGQLVATLDMSVEDAEEQVDDLILWFKTTNNIARALSDDERKSINLILVEAERRQKAAKADAKYVEIILEQHRDALLIARKRDGRYVVLTPQDERNVFVTMREFGPRSGFAEAKEWQIVQPRSVALWDIAYTTPAWAKWNRRASKRTHLSTPEIEQLVAKIREQHPKAFAVAYKEKISFQGESDLTFRYYSIRGKFTHDVEHPLTGEDTSAEVVAGWYGWKRTRGGGVELCSPDVPYYRRPSVTTSHRHWGGSYKATTPYQWETYGNTRGVWVDWDRYHSYTAARAQHAKDLEPAKLASKRRSYAISSVKKQDIEAQWEVERQKFIEEYLDASLWDDHKKGLGYKYSALSDGYHARDHSRLYWYLTRFIEEGIEFDGLTVRQVDELFTERGFLISPDQDVDSEQRLELPEQVLDFIVHDKPAVEDDGDD